MLSFWTFISEGRLVLVKFHISPDTFYSKFKRKEKGEMCHSRSGFNTNVLYCFYFLKIHSAPCWRSTRLQNGLEEEAAAQHPEISMHFCVHSGSSWGCVDFKPATAWDFPLINLLTTQRLSALFSKTLCE